MRHANQKAFLILSLFVGILLLFSLSGTVGSGGADQVDFPDIYIDESVAPGGVGSEVDPYSDFSEINWSAGGDNSITDWYAGAEDASATINLQKGEEWREQMTIGASGSATYPIITRAYGAGADPIINAADIITEWSVSGGWSSTYTDSFAADAAQADPKDCNTRVIIPAGALSTSGTKIRVTFTGHSSEDSYIDACTIGLRDGSSYSFDGAPTAITFDSESPSGTVPANGTKLSDEITFTLNEASDYLIHIWWLNGYAWRYSGSGGNGAAYEIDDALSDESTDISISGYTEDADRHIMVGEIEVETASDVYSATVTTEPYQVWYDGVKLTENDGATTSVGANEWDWAANVLYVNVGEDPDIGVLEASQRQYCIYVNAKDYITVDGIDTEKAGAINIAAYNVNFTNSDYGIVQNCVTKYGFHSGVTLRSGSHDCLVYNVEASYNGPSGVGIGNWFVNSDDNEISNCYCHDNYGSGITNHGAEATPDGPDGTWIHHNDSSENGGKGISNTLTTNTILEYNEVYGNGTADSSNGDGIRFSAGDLETPWGTNNICRYNLVYDNKCRGINFTLEIDPQCYYNILTNNGSEGHNSIVFWGYDGGEIYNNVVYNAYQYALVMGDCQDANVIVKNNIFHTSQTRTAGIYLYDNAASKHISDYNFIYGETYFGKIETGGDKNLADWQTATSQDANSSVADPLLTDPANDDFTLQVGSPCIDAGTDVGLTQDYLGNTVPQGSAPEMGAYEYEEEEGILPLLIPEIIPSIIPIIKGDL